MELMILRRKLPLFHHLMTLDKQSLARTIADIQDANSYPDLIKECRTALTHLGLTSSDPQHYTKQSWKKLISRKIIEENRRQLLESIKGFKKLNQEELAQEEFKVKDYLKHLTPIEARVKFALRTQQLRTIRMNQMNNQDFARKLWRCPHCHHDGHGLSVDSQAHVLMCQSYKHLREVKNMEVDKDLVAYFQSVMKLRDALEDDS